VNGDGGRGRSLRKSKRASQVTTGQFCGPSSVSSTHSESATATPTRYGFPRLGEFATPRTSPTQTLSGHARTRQDKRNYSNQGEIVTKYRRQTKDLRDANPALALVEKEASKKKKKTQTPYEAYPELLGKPYVAPKWKKYTPKEKPVSEALKLTGAHCIRPDLEFHEGTIRKGSYWEGDCQRCGGHFKFPRTNDKWTQDNISKCPVCLGQAPQDLWGSVLTVPAKSVKSIEQTLEDMDGGAPKGEGVYKVGDDFFNICQDCKNEFKLGSRPKLWTERSKTNCAPCRKNQSFLASEDKRRAKRKEEKAAKEKAAKEKAAKEKARLAKLAEDSAGQQYDAAYYRRQEQIAEAARQERNEEKTRLAKERYLKREEERQERRAKPSERKAAKEGLETLKRISETFKDKPTQIETPEPERKTFPMPQLLPLPETTKKQDRSIELMLWRIRSECLSLWVEAEDGDEGMRAISKYLKEEAEKAGQA